MATWMSSQATRIRQSINKNMLIDEIFQTFSEDTGKTLDKQIAKRIEFVKNQMGSKLEPIAADSPHVKDMDELLNKIADIDPTPKGALIPWMARLIAKNPTENKIEDLPRVKKDIEAFFKHKDKIENRDLNAYKTFQAVYDAVKPFGKKKSKRELERAKIEKLKDQIDTVYDGEEGWIRIPETKAASCYLGRGTRWCTAARSGNMFDHYASKDKLFIIYDRETGKKTQMHLQSNSHMDDADAPVGLDSVPDWARDKIVAWYKKNDSDNKGLQHAMRLGQLGADAREFASGHDDLFDLMKQYGV